LCYHRDVIELRQYANQQGVKPFERWFLKLDDITQARIDTFLTRMEQGGTVAKTVGGGVLELRMDFGPGYRVYFGKDGETLVILLGGGTKKRQQPDIAAAQQLWREYKQRKREQ
jgi:putative addiction module killer protein